MPTHIYIYNVLQCVAMCSSVLQSDAVCCSVMQSVVVCCVVLQWVAVWAQSTSTCEILVNLSFLYLSDEFQIVPDTITDVGDVDLEKEARNLSCLFQCDLTMARARGWWDERSADPIDSPARPYRLLLTMHATRAQDQTRERRVSPSSLLFF